MTKRQKPSCALFVEGLTDFVDVDDHESPRDV